MERTGQKTERAELDISDALSVEAGETRLRLENRLANYVGAQMCALTPGGTAGMLAALRAAGVSEGDKVLCTAFSYLAMPEIVALTGAETVFADINPNTFNLDPYCLDYALKKCLRREQPPPKVVVASDMFGTPCDYGEIEEICARYGITLIEDMSCAFGASYKGRKAGSFGAFAVASFFPSRPLSDDGDGGAVFCKTREDHKKIGLLCSGGGREDPAAGFARTSLVGEKLGTYSAELSRRQLVAARYRENFKSAVKTQQIGEETISAFTQFALALENERQREKVAEALRESKIPHGVVTGTKPARTKKSGRLLPANTQDAAKRLLTIPLHPHLSFRVVDYISECVLKAIKE